MQVQTACHDKRGTQIWTIKRISVLVAEMTQIIRPGTNGSFLTARFLTGRLLPALLLYLALPPARAEVPYPIITVECNKQDDVLKIKNEVKWGKAGKDFPFSAKDGTYNPWDWVDIVKMGNYRHVKQVKSVELSCELSMGRYKVILEPKIFNPNYNGSCGDHLSATVTIFYGTSYVVDKLPFESFCLGNAPVIRGVKVFGDTGTHKIYKVPKSRFY